jgi:hypothetical protein
MMPRVPAAAVVYLLVLAAFLAFIDSRKRYLSPFISKMWLRRPARRGAGDD